MHNSSINFRTIPNIGFDKNDLFDSKMDAVAEQINADKNLSNVIRLIDTHLNSLTKKDDKLTYLENVYSLCDTPQLFVVNPDQDDVLKQIKSRIVGLDTQYFSRLEQGITKYNESKSNQISSKVEKQHVEIKNKLKIFNSAEEFNQFILEECDKGNYEIMNKKETFLTNIDKQGYSIGKIEQNGYIDLQYNEETQQFEIRKDSKLEPVDVRRNHDLKDAANDLEIKQYGLDMKNGYAAPKAQVTKLREELATFIVNDEENYSTYLNALTSEVSVQFLNAKDDDLIWNDEETIRSLSTNVSDLGKTLKTIVFPEITTKQQLVDLLKDEEEIKSRFDTLAQTLLMSPKVLINKNIAQNFCKHKDIDFDKIRLANNHYYPASGKPEDILADGDCFFHTISKLLEEKAI